MSDMVKMLIVCSEYESAYEYDWFPSETEDGYDMSWPDSYAFLVPREDYDRWMRARESFFEAAEEIADFRKGQRP